MKAKARPGSHTVTVQRVDQRRRPARLRPRKTAPTAGPVTPRDQSPPTFSGLYSPIAGRSETSCHTRSGGAATDVLREMTKDGAGVMSGTVAVLQDAVVSLPHPRGIMGAMPLPSRVPRLAVSLLVAASLAGCGDADPVPAGDRPIVAQPDNPAVAPGVADPTAPRIISVVSTDGRLTGDTGVVQVKLNAPIRIVVISDETDTVLVKGYDLRSIATAEVPMQLDFIADEAGEFAVVLEESGRELTRLRVG